MTEFSSVFGGRISSFLDYRTARGFKRGTHLRYLIKFDRWCMQAHPEQALLSRELVLDWIGEASASSYDIAQRAASIRQFARYLCAIGEEAYILPEKYALLRAKQRRISLPMQNLQPSSELLTSFRLRKRNLF